MTSPKPRPTTDAHWLSFLLMTSPKARPTADAHWLSFSLMTSPKARPTAAAHWLWLFLMTSPKPKPGNRSRPHPYRWRHDRKRTGPILIVDWSLSLSGSSGASQERSAGGEDSEEDQWSLWGRLLADWDNNFKRKNIYVKELVRKGVPQHFRGVVWPLLWYLLLTLPSST